MIWRLLVGGAVLGGAIVGCTPHAPGPRPSGLADAEPAQPNVIVILADDAGYADFGFQGSEQFRTPNLDAMARQGVRFTQGYVTSPACSPSRAGLMTGRYQQRFGHESNLVRRYPETVAFEQWGLPLSERTMGDIMRDLGYRTGVIGKWHLGDAEHFHPNRRGFDEFYGFIRGHRSYFPYDGEPPANRGLEFNGIPQPEPDYLTDDLSRAAADFIRRHRTEPFFLFLSYTAVHGPMHGKPEQERQFAHIQDETRRTLAAMTLALDEGVGEVMEALADHGLEENTLVFFLNDNGGPVTVNASSNLPLRGAKGTKFEGGVRVPFLARWPAGFPAGMVYDQPVSALDILPTAIAAATGSRAAALPENLDGVDLLPYLKGEQSGSPHRTLFWRRGPIAAVRKDDWKLIRVQDGTIHLFDLERDLGEIRNLADQRPEIREDLLRELRDWERGLVEPLWEEFPRAVDQQLRNHQVRS